MAFLRVEKKKSGTYLRIVQSFRDNGRTRHKTLHSLGKVEDYPPQQLERIASKLLELAGCRLEDVIQEDLKEIRRVNYGYALVIKKLWRILDLDHWMCMVNNKRRIRFDWLGALELMIAERMNEPCSKRASHLHQTEYIGLGRDKPIDLHQLYRTLDLLADEQESLKKHLFTTQQSLFSITLDVVFYDVTTLYFDSQREVDQALAQKGYSKDGKAHKTQIVLGLLVDKLRNPITYHIYKGNTYEGKTMQDALEDLKKKYKLDKVIAVADSAMIDKDNRQYMEQDPNIDYILGDRLKNLSKTVSAQLIDKNNHKSLYGAGGGFTYTTLEHDGRTIICTYSPKRASKDQHSRDKLLEKARMLLTNESRLKQSKRRGAGRYITQTTDQKYVLDEKKILSDARWDGYKAISTTANLEIQQVLEKYKDLFEVEHAFRTLKSQLEIRPMFHWTDKRIEGHIAMCFMAYTMLNHLRLTTQMQHKQIVRAMDQMQLSEIEEKPNEPTFYLRSNLTEDQVTLIDKLKMVVPKDTTSQNAVNLYFR